MKKIAAGLMTILLLVLCASAALAAPEPTKLVEVFRKPGVNYGGFKSIGNAPKPMQPTSRPVRPNLRFSIT